MSIPQTLTLHADTITGWQFAFNDFSYLLRHVPASTSAPSLACPLLPLMASDAMQVRVLYCTILYIQGILPTTYADGRSGVIL